MDILVVIGLAALLWTIGYILLVVLLEYIFAPKNKK